MTHIHPPWWFQHLFIAPLNVPGLVGYVDYPSQQLVSGLVSVDNLANVSTTVSTDCLKPGVALPTYNGTGIADGLVRVRQALDLA